MYLSLSQKPRPTRCTVKTILNKVLVCVFVNVRTFWFFGRFPQSREAPIDFAMSVCLSVRLSEHIVTALTGQISVKFDIGDFYKTLSRNYKFAENRTKMSDTLHEDLSRSHCCRWYDYAIKFFYAAFNIVILLTVICSQTIHTQHIVTFPLQQWLCERATTLYVHYVSCLLIYFTFLR